MSRALAPLMLFVGGVAAASPALPADVPLPPHAKVISVENGTRIHAAYTWKVMLTVDCKAKPVIVARAKLDKQYTVKASAAEAVLELMGDQLRVAKRPVTMTHAPTSLQLEMSGSRALTATPATASDGCGPQIALTVGPAGG